MQSPRAKLPSTLVTPAGSQAFALGERRRRASVEMRGALGRERSGDPFLRAVIGLDGVKNQVQRPPEAMRASGEGARRRRSPYGAPVVAISPPRSWWACRRANIAKRARGHRLDLGGDARHERDQRRIGIFAGGAVLETVDIREQHSRSALAIVATRAARRRCRHSEIRRSPPCRSR